MIVAFYWFFIALTLFLVIGLDIHITDDSHPWYKYTAHIVSIGAPVAFATIMLADSAYEYSGGGIVHFWCRYDSVTDSGHDE